MTLPVSIASRRLQATACQLGAKGGRTAKVHAAIYALDLSIKVLIAPGQSGDFSQARGLIGGLTGDGHVTADVAYGADYLRRFIAEDLGAIV